MNPIDDQLDRLLHAAGMTAPAVRATAPYGLETRVLAAWRAAEPFDVWNMTLLVRGLVLASVIMALSFLPALSQNSTPATDYLQLADSTLQVDNSP